jgi:hypothetical protein
MLQRAYNMRFDKSMSKTEMAEELYRQRLNNLFELQKQLELSMSERTDLDEGRLPKRMLATYGSTVSGSVPVDFGLLSRDVSVNIRSIINQIDAIQSDIQKTVANANKATKPGANTTIIQIANTSLMDVEAQLVQMLRRTQTSLEERLPDQPQLVQVIMQTIVDSIKGTVHPVIARTKETLLLEK